MAEEHSFDIVSKVDFQEVENALSQTRKEIGQRYDFKSTRVEITREKEKITVVTENEFKLHAVIDIIQNRFVKRAVPLKNIQYSKPEAAFGGTIRQVLTITTGIPLEKSKEIVKDVKDKKFKVQSSMQGDQIRVWSKSKDELQKVIQFLREKDYGLELQFANYR
ncbi:MAG: YajQ family cyclic di-GMP-binding protein [Candidatus Hydrogenedentes bacterium CG07_land_8_20_14_0_80_42_17]|nr:MAG: YajQ family cyclic di-GMP-binding protein [Candidatus Hydrogenedentes bacterium CG1_02_42_14]PIU48858.1 MAG: YajQ family cyclic di-GMP-binding protein [Candidatus Hydrogenedentes bacterium CG07_land_8_20_14_0_80_42_17]